MSTIASGTMASKEKHNLLRLLAEHAYTFNPGGFQLASGRMSDEYLDCRMALSQPEALVLLGNLFLSHADPRTVAIGGMTMGADPVAIATAMASAQAGRQPTLRWFSVRKEAKGHGQKRLIEGDVKADDSVAVVDDVVTTGNSTVQSIQNCREFGLRVVQVMVLVDREQDNGLQRIKDVAGPNVPAIAMFTRSEVRAEWQALACKTTALHL